MKKLLILIVIITWTSIGHTSDISDTFTQKYNSFVPAESSSVGSDYLFEQIALGSDYTVRILDQLNTNDEKLNEKVDILIEKFDILIEQNKTMIQLLKQNSQGS